jgi:NAD-dependent dihydropyrimidine dehydrogenase PreA subunit
MFIINVDLEKCTGCGECVNVCPVQVYELGPDGKTNPVNAGECVGCMSCVEVCPVQCITVTEM